MDKRRAARRAGKKRNDEASSSPDAKTAPETKATPEAKATAEVAAVSPEPATTSEGRKDAATAKEESSNVPRETPPRPPSRLESGTGRSISDSRRESPRMSEVSFKNWHKRMQINHEQDGRPVFRLWKWCYKGCVICRWFDAIEYDRNLCRCCFKFKTFKSIGTSCIMLTFLFFFLFATVQEEMLPGPTVFFLLVMVGSSYFIGFLISFAGIPSMIGFLLTGFCFRNSPLHTSLEYDAEFLHEFSWHIERFYLLVALVRAGLLLNLARIKNKVRFIISISIIPLVTEYFIVILASHGLLLFSLDWSALQASLLSIVSLATITSVMEKNRIRGYGEDKNLSTVLIAAAAFSVILGIFLNATILSYLFMTLSQRKPMFWMLILYVAEQIFVGLLIGFLTGFLAAFFPDKHNENASYLRILMIGLGSLAITSACNIFEMTAAGVLGAITFCITASNMWEEIGWHDYHNPVQYFYSKLYYLGQPIALTLIGFSVDFLDADLRQICLSFIVILLGLSGRELACFLTTLGGIYPTNMKENLYICIAWLSKGTFQALLVFAADHMTERGSKNASEKDLNLFRSRVKVLKESTVMAILIATPLANYGLTLLTPILLTRAPDYRSEPEMPNKPSKV